MLTDLLIRLPDAIGGLALAAVVAVAIPVQLGLFHPYVVIPLFVIAAFGALKLLPACPSAGRIDSRWWAVGAAVTLVVAIGWFLINREYASQLVSVRRDPAIYTLRGIWLMDHPSPNVVFDQHYLDLRRAVPDLSLYQGTETDQAEKYLQSTTIVPGLIAVAGWIGGIGWLLQANVLIGAGALIAVYSLGRRLAGPVFGLIPVAGLAFSMPLMAFSRAPYTEPLSVLAVCIGATGLLLGARGGGRRSWLLGGLGIGLAALTRIDGLLVVIGAVVGLGACVGLAVARRRRKEMVGALIWFAIGAVPTTLLGLTDLWLNSPDYLKALGSQAKTLWVVLALVSVVAVAVRFLPDRVQLWTATRRRMIALVVCVASAAAFVVLALRPLLQISRHSIEPYATEVRIRQQREGLPIDPTRSYDELSVSWLAWYFGWAVVTAGACAAIALLWRIIAGRRQDLLVGLAPMGISLAYLVRVQITPDQVWAMRRFLPAVLPGILVVLGWALAVGAGLLARTWRERSTAIFAMSLSVGMFATITPAVLTTRPLEGVREGAGQVEFVRQICARIPGGQAAILGAAPVMGYYQVTLLNLCGIRTVALVKSTPAQVAALAAAWGGDITVVVFDPKSVTWAGAAPKNPDVRVDYQMWETPISRPPRSPVDETTTAYLATIAADGRLVPRGQP